MFKPPLVLALLRDELREHGVYYQSQFWRLVPPHFVYFSLILSKNSVKAGKDLSHLMRLFGYPLFLETLDRSIEKAAVRSSRHDRTNGVHFTVNWCKLKSQKWTLQRRDKLGKAPRGRSAKICISGHLDRIWKNFFKKSEKCVFQRFFMFSGRDLNADDILEHLLVHERFIFKRRNSSRCRKNAIFRSEKV